MSRFNITSTDINPLLVATFPFSCSGSEDSLKQCQPTHTTCNFYQNNLDDIVALQCIDHKKSGVIIMQYGAYNYLIITLLRASGNEAKFRVFFTGLIIIILCATITVITRITCIVAHRVMSPVKKHTKP